MKCSELSPSAVEAYRVVAVEVRVEPLQGRDLRKVVDDDVGTVGIMQQIILMVALGGIKARKLVDAGNDWCAKRMCVRKLCQVGACHLFLRRSFKENIRAILATVIGALAVEFRRVMRDRKEDAQYLPIA